MKIERAKKLVAVLKKLRDEAQAEHPVTVQVGYTQNYAIYVHENLKAKHPVGQAKFLEAPARRYGDEIGKQIHETYRKTKSLRKSVLVGALRLQRESQLLCPVDTSALRASAYTAFEEDAATAAAKAKAKGDAIHKAVKAKKKKAARKRRLEKKKLKKSQARQKKIAKKHSRKRGKSK